MRLAPFQISTICYTTWFLGSSVSERSVCTVCYAKWNSGNWINVGATNSKRYFRKVGIGLLRDHLQSSGRIFNKNRPKERTVGYFILNCIRECKKKWGDFKLIYLYITDIRRLDWLNCRSSDSHACCFFFYKIDCCQV